MLFLERKSYGLISVMLAVQSPAMTAVKRPLQGLGIRTGVLDADQERKAKVLPVRRHQDRISTKDNQLDVDTAASLNSSW
jgi:hypothetical protein